MQGVEVNEHYCFAGGSHLEHHTARRGAAARRRAVQSSVHVGIGLRAEQWADNEEDQRRGDAEKAIRRFHSPTPEVRDFVARSDGPLEAKPPRVPVTLPWTTRPRGLFAFSHSKRSAAASGSNRR